jgi:hypothetical protein
MGRTSRTENGISHTATEAPLSFSLYFHLFSSRSVLLL